ncbi:MAG: hypothetical protein ACLU1W_04885 [Collinsella sp.]
MAEFAAGAGEQSWLVPLIGVISAVAAIIVTLNAAMTAYSGVNAGIVAVAQGSVNLAFLPVIAVIVADAVIALLVMVGQ